MTSGLNGDLLARGHPIPLARQLAAGLEAAIRDGHVGAGARLPSTRDLARRLGVHRSTVGAAYARLRRRGCIEGTPGRRPSVPAWSVRPPIDAADAAAGPTGSCETARRLVAVAIRAACEGGLPRHAVVSALRAAARDFQPGPNTGRPEVSLFEPRPGLRATLVAEVEARVGVTARALTRPPRGPVAGPVLARREVVERLDARPDRAASSAGGAPPPLLMDLIPFSLAGGTRERGIVHRAVRAGLVVLFSPSATVRRYASELAVREYARGVSFAAVAPGEAGRAVRLASAARLVLYDAASRGRVPPGRTRAEPVHLVPAREIERLRSLFAPPEPAARTGSPRRRSGRAPTWCGT